MLKNLCVPFKGFSLNSITQGWSEQHQAFDLVRTDGKSYGCFLVAMENCIVENIVEANEWDNGWEYDRGFGVLLRSIANPEVKYSYWHCLSFFPVVIGMTVKAGEPVAQMGNSGFVMSNGVVVLRKDKLKYPFPGTHLHLSAPQDTLDRVDWSKEIKFDLLMTIYLTFFSIKNFLSKNIK